MFGDLGKIMKIAGQVRTRMPEIQAKLAESHYVGEAGGAVKATVNGKLELVDLAIDRGILAELAADAARLEDLVKAAVSSAQEAAKAAAAEAVRELTGGMHIPGLTDMIP
jgi:hypothetical protein